MRLAAADSMSRRGWRACHSCLAPPPACQGFGRDGDRSSRSERRRRVVPSSPPVAGGRRDPMSAFASKVSAWRRRPRWWVVVLAAIMAVPFVAGVSARAEAAAVEWTPYSGSAQFMDDSCGYPTDVAATFSGRGRPGRGPDRTPGISSSLTTTPSVRFIPTPPPGGGSSSEATASSRT